MSLRRRLPTAAILAAILVAAVEWASPRLFFVLLQIVILVGLLEFYGLARRRKIHVRTFPGAVFALLLQLPWVVAGLTPAMAFFGGLCFLSVYYLAVTRSVEDVMAFPSSLALTVFGAVYLGFTLGYVYGLRSIHGKPALYFLFVVVICGDTGAFLWGKLLGRHKLIPLASPHKTREGAVGGLAFAAFGALAVRALFIPGISPAAAALAGVLVHAVAQIGDPIESLFKRAAGVKDSSQLLPGHGGFLDRLDSYLLTAPFFFYYLEFFWT